MSETEKLFQETFIDPPDKKLKDELTALRRENERLERFAKLAIDILEREPANAIDEQSRLWEYHSLRKRCITLLKQEE